MKGNKDFRIDIFGLKTGVHEFSFDFKETLFENQEDSLIENGQGTCDIELVKKDRLIEVNFDIHGSIKLTCDRSMEEFDYPISIQEQLILKYGEEFDDSEDDIWTIPSGQQSINIEKNIFDYLTLAVPMKKLHPRFEEEEEDDEYELELVYSSDEEEVEDTAPEEEEIDPRWALLKKIKNKEN